LDDPNAVDEHVIDSVRIGGRIEVLNESVQAKHHDGIAADASTAAAPGRICPCDAFGSTPRLS